MLHLVVSAWIVNSVFKELVNAFSHMESTEKLLNALIQRFGYSNGPRFYKL